MATPATIIKGDDLMLFDNAGKSIAYATAHTLSVTADTADTSTKDHGVWSGSEVTKISWEITSENLYTDTAYDTLMTSMLAKTPIQVYFGKKSQTDADKSVADGDYANWTGASGAYTGKALITSLVANANTGQNATFSITLKGNGKLTKATTVPVAG